MAKFTLRTAKVEIEGGVGFDVRGLSPNDVVQLVSLHRPVLEGLFDRFSGRDAESITQEETFEVAMNMAEQAPALVAHIIALAADDVASYEDYLDLPVGIQVDAIEKIGAITFASSGGPKKILGQVIKAMQARPSPTSLQT